MVGLERLRDLPEVIQPTAPIVELGFEPRSSWLLVPHSVPLFHRFKIHFTSLCPSGILEPSGTGMGLSKV